MHLANYHANIVSCSTTERIRGTVTASRKCMMHKAYIGDCACVEHIYRIQSTIQSYISLIHYSHISYTRKARVTLSLHVTVSRFHAGTFIYNNLYNTVSKTWQFDESLTTNASYNPVS